MENRNYLIYLSVKYHGDWDQIFRAMREKEECDDEDVLRVVSSLKCNTLTFIDEEYPPSLKMVYQPPIVLYYWGDISLINNISNNLGIVGSRDASPDILEKTREIVHELDKDLIIVSGLAYGVDGMAHRAAIESNHKTIAILGSGLDTCYPSKNRDLYDIIKRDHLLMSEYPIGESPRQDYFPRRNRIIMGLSSRIFVPAAKIKSGTSITIMYANDSGRDVCCLPSVDYGESACNLAIKHGAILVENAEDINLLFGK